MATINIRTDIDTKKKAEQLFADFGLSMTSAINVFLKQVIREKRIPFEIGYETPNSLTAKVHLLLSLVSPPFQVKNS